MGNDDGKVVLCKTVFRKWKNPRTNYCETVDKFTWKTVNRLEVSMITFGATLIEINVPDRDGNTKDILLGYYKLEDYIKDGKYYFGSTTGPISGVIKNGKFCVKGKLYQFEKNYKQNHFKNGGENGFSRINWISFIDGTDVILSHAADGSRRFPGIALVQILFSVKANNTLIIKITARSNQVTPIDISNQLYFNLASHDAGVNELMDHVVLINANQICEKNSDGLFRKTISKLSLSLDLSSLSKVSEIIEKTDDETIDCLFLVEKNKDVRESQLISRVIHPQSGRVLEVFSNQPTLHFSTCSEFPMAENDPLKSEEEIQTESIENFTLEYLRSKLTEKEIEIFKCRADTDSIQFSDKNHVDEDFLLPNGDCRVIDPDNDLSPNESIIGKGGSIYSKNCGFSIACHNFPNANHQRKHPEILLKPGKIYENLLTLKFGIHISKKPKQESTIHDSSNCCCCRASEADE